MSDSGLADWAVSRWWDDPFSRGAWSLLRVGGSPETRRALGLPVNERVIIAGEATHPDQAGMTHGAYEEGRRAAQWCLDQGHRRVVVVGAGAAGLGAARLLADSGVAVTVVEGRDRIGGRIRSVPLGDDLTVELGANWLQQGARNSLATIAESIGLRLVNTDFHAPVDLGRPTRTDALADDRLVAELRRRMDRIEGDDRSIASVVDEWMSEAATGRESAPWSAEQIAAVVDCEIFLDAGAPLDDLSARYGFEPGVGEGDRWIVGGYRQILDELATGLDLRLDWPIDRVTATATATATNATVTERLVTVSGRRGELTADAVIVTVPVAVLKAGSLRFEPPLPAAHADALDLLTAGRVEKAALRFDRRWWPTSESGYLRVLGDRPGCVAEFLDLTDAIGTPAIVGLFVGPWVGEIWEDRSDRQVAESVCEVLMAACSGLDVTGSEA